MKNGMFVGLWMMGLGTPLLAAPTVPPLDIYAVHALADIRDISLVRRNDRWEVQVDATKPVEFSGRSIAEGHRFYVDFMDSRLATGESTYFLSRDGVTVRAAQFSVDPPIVRVVVQSSDGGGASLAASGPSSQAVIRLPLPDSSRPVTRIEISPGPTRSSGPRRVASRSTRSRSQMTSRGGRIQRFDPTEEVFHPDALEAFDEPPVPSDGGSLLPVMASALPDALMEGARAALSGNRKYVWGGETPNGFDCSGMMQFMFRHAGIRLPRTAAEQFKTGTPVETADLQPGDLLFFSNGKRIFHVGIYIGNGLMFHASNPKRGLTTDRLDKKFYASRYAGARRHF